MSVDLITLGQVLSLRTALAPVTDDLDAQIWIAGCLVGREITSLSLLTASEWRKLRGRAFPDWAYKNWEVSKDFRRDVAALYAQWQEEANGQLRLL